MKSGSTNPAISVAPPAAGRGLWSRFLSRTSLWRGTAARHERPSRARTSGNGTGPSTAALSLLALGVVYGDIGTSPLYAVKETFNPDHGLPLTADNVLGGLSTIFWILMIVVSLKYVMLMLRADNHGEGGIMALSALVRGAMRKHARWTPGLLVIAVLGASLFYGDAVLTPAISVLSAIEGLEVGTSAFSPYIVPLAAGILLGVFLIQARGTGGVGILFGPVCALWFVAIGACGLWNIAAHPDVLRALDPLRAVAFVSGHGVASFLALGSVLLAVTGAEALYADVGHFGKRPIRVAWFTLVAPALVLNYCGQGAVLMNDPQALANPFYLAFPSWALYPMVALATAATVIASQATISGAYSMTSQAVQLGYLPRMNIRHTSDQTIGQIYIPAVNWVLLAAVVVAVITFGSSSALAAAYGVAVMGTMLTTTILTFFLMRFGWRYPLWLALGVAGFLVTIESTLFSAAVLKVGQGGWFPLAVGAGVFIVMTTWHRGRHVVTACLRGSCVPLEPLLETLFADPPPRVPGTAVFLTARADATPSAMLHNLRHNKVLHARVVFLTVKLRSKPYVAEKDRVTCQPLGHGCWRVRMSFGFMQRPDVMNALPLCAGAGLDLRLTDTTFFVSRATVVPGGTASGMALWRQRLFAAMSRNAGDISDHFNLPQDRVIELGTPVQI
jgi:KUP system potassium uptake protein